MLSSIIHHTIRLCLLVRIPHRLLANILTILCKRDVNGTTSETTSPGGKWWRHVEDRSLLNALCIEKGWNVDRMIVEFPARQWKQCTLFDLVKARRFSRQFFQWCAVSETEADGGMEKTFQASLSRQTGHRTRLIWTTWTIQSGAPFSNSSILSKKSMKLITWNKSWSAAGTQLARNWLIGYWPVVKMTVVGHPFTRWTYWTSLALILTFTERSDWFSNDL